MENGQKSVEQSPKHDKKGENIFKKGGKSLTVQQKQMQWIRYGPTEVQGPLIPDKGHNQQWDHLIRVRISPTDAQDDLKPMISSQHRNNKGNGSQYVS
jgi:hypothetical protein